MPRKNGNAGQPNRAAQKSIRAYNMANRSARKGHPIKVTTVLDTGAVMGPLSGNLITKVTTNA